jgi:membrane protease YdiL (CAAX protease family)
MKTHLGPPPRPFSGGEFALVVALAFGISIVGSLAIAFSHDQQPIVFGDAELYFTVGYEIVIGGIVALVLWRRGWKWSDFAVHYSKGTTIFGVLLAIVVLAAWVAIEAVFGSVPVSSSAGLVPIVSICVVNPWFEELLVLAYVVQAVRERFGITTAVNVSLAIRITYHLYEGPHAIIPIAIFGLVATVVFVRVGRLWPVVVMHGVLDFAGLVAS